jgi:DNA-binding beta-propeller fold protein YncE
MIVQQQDANRFFLHGFSHRASGLDFLYVGHLSDTMRRCTPALPDPTGVAITPDGTDPYERDDRRHQSPAYVTNHVSTIDGSNFPASAVSVKTG